MIAKYTQPSAYFPDFDQGSSLLAATSPGGLLLVILILIRFAKSWRGIVGVPWGMKVRKEGMVADVGVAELEGERIRAVWLHSSKGCHSSLKED